MAPPSIRIAGKGHAGDEGMQRCATAVARASIGVGRRNPAKLGPAALCASACCTHTMMHASGTRSSLQHPLLCHG